MSRESAELAARIARYQEIRTVAEAKLERDKLMLKRDREDQPLSQIELSQIRRIAGVDVAVRGDKVRAAWVVLDYPSLSVLEEATAETFLYFPYVPGYLSFREIPGLLLARGKISTPFDLVVVDGHGRSHPTQFGIASQLGVELSIPTIGCAKSKLVGHAGSLSDRVHSETPLVYRGEQLGTLLRSRERVKPLFISSGFRIELNDAVALIRSCLRGRRLPEPARLADRLSKNWCQNQVS